MVAAVVEGLTEEAVVAAGTAAVDTIKLRVVRFSSLEKQGLKEGGKPYAASEVKLR